MGQSTVKKLKNDKIEFSSSLDTIVLKLSDRKSFVKVKIQIFKNIVLMNL